MHLATYQFRFRISSSKSRHGRLRLALYSEQYMHPSSRFRSCSSERQSECTDQILGRTDGTSGLLSRLFGGNVRDLSISDESAMSPFSDVPGSITMSSPENAICTHPPRAVVDKPHRRGHLVLLPLRRISWIIRPSIGTRITAPEVQLESRLFVHSMV